MVHIPYLFEFKLGKKRNNSKNYLETFDGSALFIEIEDNVESNKSVTQGWYLLYFILPILFLAIVLSY